MEPGFIFADSLSEVVSIASGFSFDVIQSDGDIRFDCMVGAMNIIGNKKNGMIFISAKESDMRILTSYMTGASVDEIKKEDMCDALCELVNMTAGNVKIRISDPDYMFMLSLPFAITGENVSVITKSHAKAFTQVLGNGEISLKLKVIY